MAGCRTIIIAVFLLLAACASAYAIAEFENARGDMIAGTGAAVVAAAALVGTHLIIGPVEHRILKSIVTAALFTYEMSRMYVLLGPPSRAFRKHVLRTCIGTALYFAACVLIWR